MSSRMDFPTHKPPMLAAGERIYAIGDVHGCFELLEKLVASIRRDDAERGPCRTTILMVGDLVDRGPQSASVVEHLLRLSRLTDRLIVLKGNHEQMMVEALNGDVKALEAWLDHGGVATLASWGVPPDALAGPAKELLKAARTMITEQTLDWLDDLPLSYRSGDYFFVHAGIRPGVDLKKQAPDDLMWIRDEFLGCEDTHPAIIVHGHSIETDGPERRPNRIGLDTGAYRTGKLSAVGIQDDRQWMLTT